MRIHPINKYLLLATFISSFCFFSCQKRDDHNKLNYEALGKNLFDEISSMQTLSKFREYLVKTGLDKELASSKTYTVWAPTNDVLQNLDAATVADSAQLRAVLMNHIANLIYYTKNAVQRIQLLNGKWCDFSASKFDDAGITAANLSVGNGVLHIVDKVVKPLPSIWEFANNTVNSYKQNAYLVKINFKVRDLSNAIVDSIGQLTGQPVYRPGTDSAIRNRFLSTVLDVKDESKLFTYFVIKDDNFLKEADSLNSYFRTSRADSTDSLSRFHVLRDLAFEGLYLQNQLPDTLTSIFGVKVPLKKSAIIQTIRASNGIIYIMDNVDIPTLKKFTPLIAQGEEPRSFMVDKRANINYRRQQNPATAAIFNDIQISGHNVTNYWAQYRLNNVPSAKYKVYWVAVNNFTSAAFTQRLAMGSAAAPLTALPYTNVPLNNYNEVLVGEYTVPTYGVLDVYLTANGTGPMVLDYFKLVPTN